MSMDAMLEAFKAYGPSWILVGLLLFSLNDRIKHLETENTRLLELLGAIKKKSTS